MCFLHEKISAKIAEFSADNQRSNGPKATSCHYLNSHVMAKILFDALQKISPRLTPILANVSIKLNICNPSCAVNCAVLLCKQLTRLKQYFLDDICNYSCNNILLLRQIPICFCPVQLNSHRATIYTFPFIEFLFPL